MPWPSFSPLYRGERLSTWVLNRHTGWLDYPIEDRLQHHVPHLPLSIRGPFSMLQGAGPSDATNWVPEVLHARLSVARRTSCDRPTIGRAVVVCRRSLCCVRSLSSGGDGVLKVRGRTDWCPNPPFPFLFLSLHLPSGRPSTVRYHFLSFLTPLRKIAHLS